MHQRLAIQRHWQNRLSMAFKDVGNQKHAQLSPRRHAEREAAIQNWSTRVLERQISTLYYERLLSSPDKEKLLAETQQNIKVQTQTPRDFVRNPVMLEFLGLPDTGRLLEADLERALMDKLQQFLLEPYPDLDL